MQLKESFQIDLTLYRSAQDLFEAARETARDTECIAKQVQSMQLLIDAATAIIYGHDGCHGIRLSLGNSYANVLWAVS